MTADEEGLPEDFQDGNSNGSWPLCCRPLRKK